MLILSTKGLQAQAASTSCATIVWLQAGCVLHMHMHMARQPSRVGHLQGRKLWNDVMQMVQIVTQSVLYMVWLPYMTTRFLWILCSINVYVYIYINSNEQLVHALTYSIFHTNTQPNVHSLPGGVFTVVVNTAVSAVRCEVETFTVILQRAPSSRPSSTAEVTEYDRGELLFL